LTENPIFHSGVYVLNTALSGWGEVFLHHTSIERKLNEEASNI
jgi:hypothetical protein